MNAGTPAEALVDFTGGVHICVQLSDPPSNLWELMYRAGEGGSLMGCGTDGVKKKKKTSANETSMLKHVKKTKVKSPHIISVVFNFLMTKMLYS